MQTPHIAIIGAGAIGSMLGACLARAGHNVTLIARPEHAEQIRRQGLQVDGRLGSFTQPVAAEAALSFQPDLAFLTVKSQDVLPALQANLEHLGGAQLVTFQNGVRSDDLAATLLPKEHIASAVVSISATYLAPGKLTVVYPGTLVIGRPFAESQVELPGLRDVLQAAARTTIAHDIRGVHWLKLLFNLNNAFPALTNTALHDLYAQRYMRELAARLIREGLRVVNAAGIHLESLPEVSVATFRMVGALPTPLAGLLVASRARRVAGEWPLLGSTLQSIRRGRPTEIDYLNGEIVQLGERVGVRASLNARLVELVHDLERSGQFLSIAELKQRLDD